MTTITLAPNSRIVVTRRLRLPSGHFVTLDHQDYDLVSQYKWYVHKAKGGRLIYARNVYWESGKSHNGPLMHNLIMGVVGVDHANHNGLDNRRSNLRVAGQSRNTQNSRLRSDNTSGYKGVSWHKQSQTWTRTLNINGRSYFKSCFDTPEEAARDYDRMARIHFGEFATLNFPDEESEYGA